MKNESTNYHLALLPSEQNRSMQTHFRDLLNDYDKLHEYLGDEQIMKNKVELAEMFCKHNAYIGKLVKRTYSPLGEGEDNNE